MNVQLFERQLESPQKILAVEVKEESLKIEFSHGSDMDFLSHHGQDCCEHVYADFSVVKYHVEALKDRELRALQIKGVERMGFLMCFQFGYSDYEKIFVPCYNYQNGYYSDQLELQIIETSEQGAKTTTHIDVRPYTEDHID